MPDKIVFIHGSPRKQSTTRFLTSIVAQAAKNAGAHIDEIDVTKLKFKIPGCTGCGKCQRSDEFVCSINDELAQTAATLINYDAITIATPTYWMSYSAQTKMLIDRMGSLMKYDEAGKIQTPLSGKKMAIVATGNGGMENNMDLLKWQLNSMANLLSCQFYSCMFPNTPMDVGALKDNSSAMEKAEKFGKLLAGITA